MEEIKRDEHGKLLPGQESLNPAGRPKGSVSINDRIRQIFLDDPEAFNMWVKNYMQDPSNAKHIHDQMEGKPKQSIEHAGDAKLPFVINVTKYDGGDTGGEGDISAEEDGEGGGGED